MAEIALVEYDPVWPVRYQELARAIRGALGPRVRLLEHAGSTAIPGLAAKPKIDILLGVDDAADEGAYRPPLEAAGFAFALREPEWHEHRLFRRQDVEANLHVFSIGSEEIERMLAFRDRLRTNAEERELYEAEKRALAAHSWERVQDYADAKSGVVEAIIGRALAESGHDRVSR